MPREKEADAAEARREEGMELALAEGRKALAEGEVPVGAVLMRGGEVLWADHNRDRKSVV